MVSADHGGGGDVVADTNHATPAAPLNFTIPFFVAGPGVPADADLYALNPLGRAQPADDANPSTLMAGATGAQPPIRNGDGGNLALNLLGLEAIATSAINARHDLNAFLFDGRTLGDDRIGDFGLDDVLVTTLRIADKDGDDLIAFGSDRDLDFAGGGQVVVTSDTGRRIISREYDGSFSAEGVTYYVYSRIGSAAGVGDADALI